MEKKKDPLAPYTYGGITVDPRALPLMFENKAPRDHLGRLDVGAGTRKHIEKCERLRRQAGLY